MWLPEAGLYYYKARMYAPQLGRFLQTDPIDVAGGVNLYAYVGNDPVNFIDPLGLCLLGFEKTGGGTYAGPDGPVVYATGGCRGIVTIEFSPMMSPRGERGSGEQCPAAGSAIAGIRAAASRTADITGNASNIAALAGLIPTPLSPGLGASAVGLKAVSGAASGILLIADMAHGVQSGNFSLLGSDFVNFLAGSVPTGRVAVGAGRLSKAKELKPSSREEKFMERSVDAAHGLNVTHNLPTMCK
jgi:RHS repeat-associated protein